MSEVKTLRYMFDWASAMCSDGPRGWSTLVEKDIPHPGFFEDGQAKNLVELIDRKAYDALAAQRDEGLAREAELQKEVARMTSAYQAERARRTEARAQNDALQQRLAEAEELLRDLYDQNDLSLGDDQRILRMLTIPGCADGEKAE